ncbi:MAG: hypothetical protein IH624_02420 [Phycisphaerae bacterium]|nr:hypothetical protein [Phycisphaerae bacterium]
MYMNDRMAGPYGQGDYGQQGMTGMGAPAAPAGNQEEGPGFVVVVEGYSPFKPVGALLDPHSVGDDRTKWGFITRLVNLDKVMPGCEFELYRKDDIKHFTLESRPVDLLDPKMPGGIGVEKEVERVRLEVDATRRGALGAYQEGPRYDETSEYRGAAGAGRQERVYAERVLVDPMTNEEMSKVFDIITQQEIDGNPDLTEKDLGRKKYDKLTNEPLFIERDYWFRVSAKVRWKKAPVVPDATTGMGGYGSEGMRRGY